MVHDAPLDRSGAPTIARSGVERHRNLHDAPCPEGQGALRKAAGGTVGSGPATGGMCGDVVVEVIRAVANGTAGDADEAGAPALAAPTLDGVGSNTKDGGGLATGQQRDDRPGSGGGGHGAGSLGGKGGNDGARRALPTCSGCRQKRKPDGGAPGPREPRGVGYHGVDGGPTTAPAISLASSNCWGAK